MKHHCLICNNKHPEILYPSREERLGAQANRLKAIYILTKLFYLPPDVQDDLTAASYCFNCTNKLCQLDEIYDQIELCRANIVQSKREIEMTLVKSSFMDINGSGQGHDNDDVRTRGNDDGGTNQTRKLLCNLIHYKPQSPHVDADSDDFKLESDDDVQPRTTNFNQTNGEEFNLTDEIGLDEVGSCAGQQSTSGVDEDIVENLESCPSTSGNSGADTDADDTMLSDDINMIDKNTSSQDEDEEMPFLELCSFSDNRSGENDDQNMEEVDDGNANPPLIDKFDKTKTLKRKATLSDLTSISEENKDLDSGISEQLMKKKIQMIDDEKMRYLKRQCISRNCLVVLQTLESESPKIIKNNLTTTPTFNKQKGPGQGRGKVTFTSPMNMTASSSGDSSLMMADVDQENTSSVQQKKISKGILTPAGKTSTIKVDRRVSFRSPIATIKIFTSEIVDNKVMGSKPKQGRKRKIIVKLVGKNLVGRAKKAKINPVLKSYKPNLMSFSDDSSSSTNAQNNENDSGPILTSSRSTTVMEKIRNSEALLKSRLNFRRTVPSKNRYKPPSKVTSTSATSSSTANPTTRNFFFCKCGKAFKMEWRYKNHLKLHHSNTQVDDSVAKKPNKPTAVYTICEICEDSIASRLYKKHLKLCKVKSNNGETIKKKKPKLGMGRQSSYDKLLQIGKSIKKAAGKKTSLVSHSARVIPIPRHHTANIDEYDQELNQNHENSGNGPTQDPENLYTIMASTPRTGSSFEIYESPTISLSDFGKKTPDTNENTDVPSKLMKGVKNDTKFRCPYTDCELEVIGKVDLIAHLKYHMSLPNGTQNITFRCPYMTCEELSGTKAILINHLKLHMDNDDETQTE